MVRGACTYLALGDPIIQPLLSLYLSFPQYGQPVTKKGSKAAAATAEPTEEKKLSNHVQRNLDAKRKEGKIDPLLDSQFAAGRLYAAISSRPGQSGRADGYILEGKELEVSFNLSPRG